MTVIFVVSFASVCGLMMPRAIDTSCEWTFRFDPTERDADIVSDRLARQIVTHNERRARLCATRNT